MDKPPELPPELSEDGGKKLTEAEIQELLRPSLRNWRRQKAARAALSLAGASRAIAQTELRREAARAVQESWPRDSYHLEQVLWPSLSKYSEVGIHLTPVATTCSMAADGRFSAGSDGI